MDQTLHGVATKERKQITRMTKEKMVRRLNMEGRNHLEQEDIDGGLHPAVDGQSIRER